MAQTIRLSEIQDPEQGLEKVIKFLKHHNVISDEQLIAILEAGLDNTLEFMAAVRELEPQKFESVQHYVISDNEPVEESEIDIAGFGDISDLNQMEEFSGGELTPPLFEDPETEQEMDILRHAMEEGASSIDDIPLEEDVWDMPLEFIAQSEEVPVEEEDDDAVLAEMAQWQTYGQASGEYTPSDLSEEAAEMEQWAAYGEEADVKFEEPQYSEPELQVAPEFAFQHLGIDYDRMVKSITESKGRAGYTVAELNGMVAKFRVPGTKGLGKSELASVIVSHLSELYYRSKARREGSYLPPSSSLAPVMRRKKTPRASVSIGPSSIPSEIFGRVGLDRRELAAAVINNRKGPTISFMKDFINENEAIEPVRSGANKSEIAAHIISEIERLYHETGGVEILEEEEVIGEEPVEFEYIKLVSGGYTAGDMRKMLKSLGVDVTSLLGMKKKDLITLISDYYFPDGPPAGENYKKKLEDCLKSKGELENKLASFLRTSGKKLKI